MLTIVKREIEGSDVVLLSFTSSNGNSDRSSTVEAVYMMRLV